MSILEAEKLTYRYSPGTPFEKTAVSDVSFTIDRPGLYALIGHTGSGKSTLIQHLNGLLRPTQGTVRLNGRDLWAEPKKIRAARFEVGLVFQYPEYQLFEETVERDIAFGPKNIGLSAAEVADRVREAAHIVGLPEELLQKSPFDLSGGEKRRAAIAGVLAMRPWVLILDEPTAGLDPRGRDRLLKTIKAYQQTSGSTVLLVSHSMEDVAETAQWVLVMERGELVLFDTVRAVFAQAERLTQAGLNVPQVTQIMAQLRRRGADVPADALTVREACAALLPLLRGGAGRAE